MPLAPPWARALLAGVRSHRKVAVGLLAAAAALILGQRLQPPPAAAPSVPASLQQALRGRAEFRDAVELIVPLSPASRLGRRPSPLPSGRLAFEDRPCFYMTPQPSVVAHHDVIVEYRNKIEFQAEVAPWVNEQASVEIRELARGTLHVRNVRRTDGLGVPDPDAPCNLDTERPDTVVTSEIVGDVSFLGWLRPASSPGPQAVSAASATQADISVAGEALRLGALLSDVRTATWRGEIELGRVPEMRTHDLGELLGLTELPGWLAVEAFDGVKRQVTVRVDTPTNEEARPQGMRLEDLCALGVSKTLRTGDTCRYVPGLGDTLVVVRWSDGSRAGGTASSREKVLQVVAYRTSLTPARAAAAR